MTTLVGLDLAGRPVLVAGGGPVAARRVAALVDGRRAGDRGGPAAVRGPGRPGPRRRGRLARARRCRRPTSTACGSSTPPPTTRRRTRRSAGWANARRVWSVCASSADAGRHALRPRPGTPGSRVAVSSDAQPGPARGSRGCATGSPTYLAAGRRGPAPPAPRAAARVASTLIGGGPGASRPDDRAGRRALFEADVVVTDRLGPTDVLDELPADVEVIDVGKAPGRHAATQHEINAHPRRPGAAGPGRGAPQGRRPVPLRPRRRGAAGAGREHGIPVEVVPGVTSALVRPTRRRHPGHAPRHGGGGPRHARTPRARPVGRSTSCVRDGTPPSWCSWGSATWRARRPAARRRIRPATCRWRSSRTPPCRSQRVTRAPLATDRRGRRRQAG